MTDQTGATVHAFRARRTSTTKATDHELQKHDNFTRYGQRERWGSVPRSGFHAQMKAM